MNTAVARPMARLLAVLALGVATLLLAPTDAFGHASEISSSPAAGEVLDTAPSEVRIDYDSALLEMGAALVVRGADDKPITTGPAVIGDRLFSVPVDASVGPGEYSVAYRVVSQDGHTIENSFTYVVAGDPSPIAVDSDSEAAGESDNATPEAIADEPSATPETIAEEPITTDDPTTTPDTIGAPPEGSFMPILLFGGVGLVIVAGIIGAVLLRR